MEEDIQDIITKIETASETIKDLGIIPDYFKDDIINAIKKLTDVAEEIKTEITY